jgi:hypothetical protein
MSTEPEMRSPDEIHRTHDLLEAVLLGETPLELTKTGRVALSYVVASLCYVLKHPAGETVADLQEHYEARLRKLGLRVSPLPPDDPRRQGRRPEGGR